MPEQKAPTAEPLEMSEPCDYHRRQVCYCHMSWVQCFYRDLVTFQMVAEGGLACRLMRMERGFSAGVMLKHSA